MKKYYLSTALPYVNDAPHLGFALEIIQADVIARYHRILGEDVFFLTGTDENSLKNVRAARGEGIPVKKLVDRNAKKFYELKKALNLSFDDFIRTTEKRHIKGAQKLWLACQKDIYKKKYRGLYCVGCEEFYKESELVNGLCPEHKAKPELVEEENYFFHLSKYQNQLKKIIEQDKIKIIPKTRKNEVLSFINQGLEDICVSRLTKRAGGWGIDVPGDPSQKIWVWFDALSNYITALGYGENNKKFQEWWQKNKHKLHIIGKGILRFHAIYWPAMLLSAKLALPKTIFVHGYLTSGGQKMSKSLGNVIDPFELVKKYGTDAVRYFLLREIPPTEDGDFTYEKFKERYNSDLAKGLGNLVARIITLAKKVKIGRKKAKIEIQKLVDKTWKDQNLLLGKFKFNEALMAIWNLISFCDKYLEKEHPWQKSKKQLIIISNLLFVLKNIAKLLQPFLPQTSEKILEQIKKRKKEILFPRL
ncbi:MAG: methionine--tRNA ligase [Patescibacteria group bacterium]|nr:methionine--tRNA ligase [Patescibacteria group bacterium]